VGGDFLSSKCHHFHLLFLLLRSQAGDVLPQLVGKEGELLPQPSVLRLVKPEQLHHQGLAAVSQGGGCPHSRWQDGRPAWALLVFGVAPSPFNASARNSALTNVSVLRANWFRLEFLFFRVVF